MAWRDRPKSYWPDRDQRGRPGRRRTVHSGRLSGIKMADCCVACLRHGSVDFTFSPLPHSSKLQELSGAVGITASLAVCVLRYGDQLNFTLSAASHHA